MNTHNSKKILCFNMLNYGKCNYGNKCDYAHSLSDQKVEPLRQKVYSIIKSFTDQNNNDTQSLKNIDLVSDKKIYDAFLSLTRMCSLCNKNLCPGGYNCRNGSINIKSKICYDDFIFGNCRRGNNCLAVHLTKKGLIPYNIQTKPKIDLKPATKPVTITLDIPISEPLNIPPLVLISKPNNLAIKKSVSCQLPLTFSEVLKSKPRKLSYNENLMTDPIKHKPRKLSLDDKLPKANKLYDELNSVEGVLLTEKFIMARYNKVPIDYDSSTDNEDSEMTESIIEYLNNDIEKNNENNNDDNDSIFLV